ncbi:MAG TPA: hypothetical protein GXZ60_14470 [Intrasporangiaceae bacterium]|nr:hypothetical protein [Intrasporangiaceae bacterium]
MGRHLIVCRVCRQQLSPPVRLLPEVPERTLAADHRTTVPPTVQPGEYAVDPYPLGATDGRVDEGNPGCLVLHPDDARELTVHPDPERSVGCCGEDGLAGPNPCCPRCSAAVATLVNDCWTVHEVRFEPAAVIVGPVEDLTRPGSRTWLS